jgi:ribosomal protein uS17
MADEEKSETKDEAVDDTSSEPEETQAVDGVSDTGVSDNGVADNGVSDTVPEPEAPASEPEAAARVEEVSDTNPVSDTTPGEPEPAEPAAPAKKQRSRRHVPRSERGTRSKVVREKPKSRKPIMRTPKPESELGRRQERRGVVVSDKGDKTIVVKVDMIKSHPKYKKVIRRSSKLHAHDEANTAGVGDVVRIVETRPLSKTKRWRLAEIVEKAK